jgi:hypothetical protein
MRSPISGPSSESDEVNIGDRLQRHPGGRIPLPSRQKIVKIGYKQLNYKYYADAGCDFLPQLREAEGDFAP